jgi:hypothetical protein
MDARLTRRSWTRAEDDELRRRWPEATAQEIARDLGRSTSGIYQRARKLGLPKRPTAWYAQVTRQRWKEGRHSRSHCFPKGHVPANKGLRRPGYAPGRMAETQFKKGNMSGAAQHNYVPIGTEKIDPKRNVLMRKVTDDPTLLPVYRWRPVHVLVWEAVHGPVPAGHIVVFRRGMKTFLASEITVDRLELVTLAENMRRNSIHNHPPELVEVMRLVGTLKRHGRKHDVREQH